MRIALAVTLALLLAPAAWCHVSVGSAQSLHIQPSARSAGMADCTIAVTEDASACSWNPGGLAFMQGDISVTGVYSQLLPDWDDVHYWYGAAGVRLADIVTLAASVTYLSYGEQLATTEFDETPYATFDSYELIPSVAFAVAIGENIGVGLNLKYVEIDLAPVAATVEGQGGVGSALAADMGVEYRAGYDIGDLGLLLRAAGAIQHLGPDLTYIDDEQRTRKDPLPNSAKIGASGQLSYGKAGHALLCAQLDKSLVGGLDNDSCSILGLGFELAGSVLGLMDEMQGGEGPGVRDVLAIRTGYVHDEDGKIKGVSYGFGLGVEMDDTVLLSLDFARVPQAADMTEPWRIGCSGWFVF